MTLRDQTTQAKSALTLGDPEKRSAGRVTIVSTPDRKLEGRSFALPPDDYFLVGRSLERAGVELADSRLSRLHFRIKWDGRSGAFLLGDAGSKNGTSLNGAPVVSSVLGAGDVIRAGDSLFVYDEGDPMAEIRQRAERAAATDLTVLLLGESGTGKEVLARLLHEKSDRKGPFVALNCAAISRDLIASELFGHAQGAFSGALKKRAGLFIAAEDGTLLLDEIGDLPLEVQAAVLRVLQERSIRPVGEDREIPVTARVVAATHLDLDAARSSGKFREDLYARLAQVVLPIKPLRERRTEILELARTFSKRPLVIEAHAAETLLLWSWPHNIRELKSLVEAFCVLERPDAPLAFEYLVRTHPKLVESRARSGEPRENDDSGASRAPAIERKQLEELLDRHGGNVTAVAKELGKVRPQVYRWLKAYGLAGQGTGRRKSH
jgi:DNA-binding NtrC family response regulator